MTVDAAPTPNQLARASAAAMWKDDRASRDLGIELIEVGAGHTTLRMIVRDNMINGHGVAHGGFIFTLADTAFAFACNSHNERALAAQCSISFVRPGKLGDRLVATAREVLRSGRTGIYDVRVSVDDVTVAEFRGHSRTIGGQLVATGSDPARSP